MGEGLETVAVLEAGADSKIVSSSIRLFTVDTVGPTLYIDAVLEGDNKANATEDDDIVITGTSGGLEAGTTVTVTVTDSSDSAITPLTATVRADGTWATNAGDISGKAQGTVTLSATAVDAAGNSTASAVTSTQLSHDSVGAVVSDVNAITSSASYNAGDVID
jgi:hypothetical protein